MALSSAEAAKRVRAALEQCAAANEIQGWGFITEIDEHGAQVVEPNGNGSP